MVGLEASLNFWLKQNRVIALPRVTLLPDLDPDDATRVELRNYGPDQVLAYVVKNGGHAWPGGWKYLGEWAIGKVSRDFNASTALLEFFSLHLGAKS